MASQYKRYVFSLVISFVFFAGFGQNLVPNPGFEEFKECPSGYSTTPQNIYVSEWESPNAGTPDYFNVCSERCGVPRNYIGFAEAHQGNAYMGLIACMEQMDEKQIPNREYIRVRLKERLRAGEQYYAQMYIRLGLSCIATCTGMGMFFSPKPLQSIRKSNYPVPIHIGDMDAKMIENPENWFKVCGTYIATGDEEFLFIGNFLNNQEMDYKAFPEHWIETRNISPMAYFYVDDVLVEPFDPNKEYNCRQLPEPHLQAFVGELEIGSRYVLNNLLFETNKAIIKPISYAELDNLAVVLNTHQQLKVVIQGHTDSVGTVDYNKKLSEDRARAVWQYLLSKQASTEQISTQGFGASQPIGDNATEEGRRQNRRVELIVTEMGKTE
jgi:outer membrane protein OmpA-like peptidoglycan-associated protein